MSGNKFIANDYVEHIGDGSVGQVKSIYLTSTETWVYGVSLGNEYKMVVEEHLRFHVHTHAHVSSQARDCDGRYLKDWTEVPTTEERTSEYGELDFKNRVLASVVTLYGYGTLDVTPEGFVWAETTEEGYCHVSVGWCDEEDCDRTSSQRDLTAESMGY